MKTFEKLKGRINQIISDLPWWWVLIAVSPILVFILFTVLESLTYIDTQHMETVKLENNVTVVFEVDGNEYRISGENTTPEGCIVIPLTKNLTNSEIGFLSCGGQSLGTLQCVVYCTITSNKIVRVEHLP